LFGNKELLERSVRLVMMRFILYISETGLVELLYISMKARPGISTVNEF